MKSLKGKFVSFFVVLPVISILGGYYVLNAISKQKTEGMTINLAGRQRMLSQKFNTEFLDELNIRTVAAVSEKLARVATRQIKADRAYYTKNIIGKLEKEWPDFKVSASYRDIEGALPLPVTFVREVSETFGKTGQYSYDLVSKWNINKGKGLRDEFEKEAWDRLSQNSKQPYGRFISAGSGATYRYATADLANDRSCVSCHNSHTDSPKNDFHIGDLMGILIVSTHVTKDPVLAGFLLKLGSSNAVIKDHVYDKTVKLFKTTLKTLREGGTTYADTGMRKPIIISATKNLQIIAKLDEVEKLWNDLQETAKKLLSENIMTPQYVKLLQKVRNLNHRVMEKMHTAVRLYMDENQADIKKQKTFQMLYVGIITIIVAFGLVNFHTTSIKKKTWETESRFGRILDNSLNEIYIFDAETLRFIQANRGAQENLGYSMDELSSLTPLNLKPEHTPESFAELIKPLKNGDKDSILLNTIHIRKDGSTYPVEENLQLSSIESSPAFVSIIHDITVRQRAEKELKESEERYRSLTETATDAIISADGDGKIISLNRGAKTLFGYKDEEVIGKPLSMLIPKRGREAHKKGFQLASLTRKLHLIGKTIELHGLRKDNTEFPIEISNATYKVGEKIYYSGIIRDISERKLSEENLRKLSQAVEQSPAIALITDTKGNIEYVNRKFCELTGYTPNEVIGKNPRILKSGEKSSEEYKELWETITSGKEWRGEFHNKKKNGEYYWEFAYISPIKNQDKETTHFLAVKEDITERKRVTEELAQGRKNLEKTVEKRTRELSESLNILENTNILLKQAKEAESKFLSSMSHELRTPLNAILGFSDLLSGQSFGMLNEEQSGFVKEIDSSGKHLLSLINDLLDVAKIDAGAMEVQLEEMSSDELIDTAVAMLRTAFKKKNISVKTTVDPAAHLVTADIRRGKQIMVNLLSNAIKYTPEDGRVDIRIMKEGDSLIRIEVSDNGIGIKEEDKEKIFSEFHLADRVRDEQLGGTGIGLALTQRLVKLHKGDIGVESEPGRGSTFWFTLPLKKPGKKKADKKEEVEIKTEITGFTNRRILVVEDNKANLRVILKMLSIKELQVLAARNGREACDLAPSFKPELILMDMRMPVMNGLEATKRLRAMPEFSDTPIIALTAIAGYEDEELMRVAGCTERLAKPFQSENLFKILQKYLQVKE